MSAENEVASTLTPRSPLEDLLLGTRALNALHQLGCRTVQDVLRHDFRQPQPRLGRKTRQEIMDALAEHQFIPREVAEEQPELRQLARNLDRLRQQMEESTRRWQSQLSGLEEKLRKLAEQL